MSPAGGARTAGTAGGARTAGTAAGIGSKERQQRRTSLAYRSALMGGTVRRAGAAIVF